MADGVDEETWDYHRRRGEYSQWVKVAVKNANLAEEIEAAEKGAANFRECPDAIRQAIEREYTLPADVPSGKIDVEGSSKK